MNIESVHRQFSPVSSQMHRIKTPRLNSDFNHEDVIIALSKGHENHSVGIEMYLAKIGATSSRKAINLLYDFALTKISEYDFFLNLDQNTMKVLVKVICIYSFDDYSRSAESTKECNICGGRGLVIEKCLEYSKRKTSIVIKSTREDENRKKKSGGEDLVVCKHCKGKGKISYACRCRGRGQVNYKINEKQSDMRKGGLCSLCHGRGFKSVKFSDLMREIIGICVISKTTAYEKVRPFFLMLSSKCHEEEIRAIEFLSKLK